MVPTVTRVNTTPKPGAPSTFEIVVLDTTVSLTWPVTVSVTVEVFVEVVEVVFVVTSVDVSVVVTVVNETVLISPTIPLTINDEDSVSKSFVP